MNEKGSTGENVFFGLALVLFLVVAFFAAKRFNLFPNHPSASRVADPTNPSPTGRFRVGIDDKGVDRPELKPSVRGGEAVGTIPQIKGAKVNKKPRTAAIPAPR
jgi:hypothetical protein